MILEALRRSVVRWFKRPATTVTPQIGPARPELDLVGQNILNQLKAAGLIPPDATVTVHRGLPPSSEPAPSRLGVKPPADVTDDVTWAWWELARGNQQVPGWAFCRFANRVGDKAVFAFGFVRGSFGIWQKPFQTCNGMHPNIVQANRLLTVGTHLLTGHAIGNFESLAIAAEACELADRVAPAWATAKHSSDLDDAIHRTQQAWAGAGIAPSPISHAHEDDGGDLLLILGRSIESVMEGKPERLS